MAWPKLTKNANFGPNLVAFGQRILFFTGEIKSFVTHITENPPGHLVHIVFGRAWDKMCKKWQYLAKNDQKCWFWTNFGPKIKIFMGVSKRFGTNITENHLHNLSALFFGQVLDQMGQKCQIWPILGPKSNFLGAGSKTFGTLISRFQWDTFFVLKTLISGAQIGR